ncbi:MAG: hypothetical protein V1716_01230 [Candidatus Uhrbacteria bacterium]
MGNKTENFDGEKVFMDSEAIRKAYERYFGVCDVVSPEQARAMADELRQNRKSLNRKIMIGVMAGHFSLRPEGDDPGGQRTVFPTREEMSKGFIDDPDVLNTVHFADLYRPKEVQTLFEDLELVVEYGGENLHAIQLDVTWPDTNDLAKFKSKHPELLIILQLGKFAFKEASNNPQKVVDQLREYGDSVDFVLLDMSMGKGQAMESEGLLPLLRLIKEELPDLGLAVAGGLGPDSMDLLEPIAKEFPGISFDAQGRLKPADTKRDSLGHVASTIPADPGRSQEYIRKSCAMLDIPPKK